MSEEIKPAETNKSRDLLLSLLFDCIGMLSYLIPVVGWITDVIWAPIAGLILLKMYKGNVGAVSGIVVFIEELLPGFDFIPTFTLTWIYTYFLKKN